MDRKRLITNGAALLLSALADADTVSEAQSHQDTLTRPSVAEMVRVAV